MTHRTPQGMTGRTQRSNVTTLRRLGRRKQRNMKGDLFELKHHCLIWEFKKRRRRRHGRSRFKNELYFTSLAILLSHLICHLISKLNMKHSVKLEIEIYKISRRRSRSSNNVVWSFHVVDFQRKQRNLQRFLTHVHSHCSAH